MEDTAHWNKGVKVLLSQNEALHSTLPIAQRKVGGHEEYTPTIPVFVT